MSREETAVEQANRDVVGAVAAVVGSARDGHPRHVTSSSNNMYLLCHGGPGDDIPGSLPSAHEKRWE